MPITNASQATEIVKAFCEKMEPYLPFLPESAEEKDGKWLVTAWWGLSKVVFELNGSTEQIEKYHRVS